MLAALDVPSSDRSGFLEIACGSDTELRRVVEALLRTSSGSAVAQPPAPAPASRIGRYELEKKLGSGAMGEVYLCRDTLLQRRVALKSVINSSGGDPEKRAWFHDRLIREARAAAALSHPNIAALHDIVDEQGVSYVVMEFVDGTTVAGAPGANAPDHVPPRDWTLNVLRQTAAGLDYAHQHGIVHRDIKPANLLIDATGTVKIVDFGIAKVLEADATSTQGLTMGTPQFMSPEQIHSEPLNGAADQFSLAAVAYVMLTGRTLFPGVTAITSLMYKHCFDQPEAPSRIQSNLSPAVDQVLARGLAKKASDRYPSCREFVASLETALAIQTAPVSLPVLPPPVVRSRSPIWGVAAGGSAVILVLAMGAWWFWTTRSPKAVAVQQPVADQKPEPEPRQILLTSPATSKPPAQESQLTPSAAKQQETKQPEIKSEPMYRGPREGQFVWTGRLNAGATVTLDDNASSTSGVRLPGVPVKVEIVPALLEIARAPSKANRWRSVTIGNSTGRTQTLIIVKWKVVQ